MKTLLFTLAICIYQVSAGCTGCGLGQGKDVCFSNPDCAPLVVRPQRLPKIDLINNRPRVVCKEIPALGGLKPVGDLCSCRKATVLPALVPRPICAACNKPTGHLGASGGLQLPSGGSISFSTSTTNHQSSQHDQTVHHDESFRFVRENSQDDVPQAPADAVSLSLAYKELNKAGRISEDKLNYGFRKLPVEVRHEKKVNNRDENLFKLNGQIVELKPVRVNSKSVDEEAAEELLEEELNEDVGDAAPIRKISLGEIGFQAADIKCGKFNTVKGTGETTVINQQQDEIVDKPCNDGFQAGRLIVQNIQTPEVYVSERKIRPCDDFEETEIRGVEYPAFSLRSQSSSSHQQSHQQQIRNSHNVVFSSCSA